MRGILTAYLALYFSGGLFSASEDAPARARFTTKSAKTTTAKAV